MRPRPVSQRSEEAIADAGSPTQQRQDLMFALVDGHRDFRVVADVMRLDDGIMFPTWRLTLLPLLIKRFQAAADLIPRRLTRHLTQVIASSTDAAAST